MKCIVHFVQTKFSKTQATGIDPSLLTIKHDCNEPKVKTEVENNTRTQ